MFSYFLNVSFLVHMNYSIHVFACVETVSLVTYIRSLRMMSLTPVPEL